MSETSISPQTHCIKTGTTPGGQGFVTVWKEQNGIPDELEWKFIPNQNNPEISFAAFGNDHTILTMDVNGQISLFDFRSRKKVKDLDMAAKGQAGAALDREQNALFVVALNREDGETYFYHLNLGNGEIEGKLKLTHYAVADRIWVMDDRHVLVYFKNGGSFSSEEGDGLYKINYRNLLVSAMCFSGACFSRFEVPPLAIDTERNIGVRPYFDRVELKHTKEGDRYCAKIQFFRPDNCRTIRNMVVREFHWEHVFEDMDPSVALEILKYPENSDEYRDIRDEFLERIDDIVLCHTEKAAWVSFQHGLVRKVSMEGEMLTPLIGHPGDEMLISKDPFIRTRHDNPISISSDDQRLTFGTPAVTVNVNGISGTTEEELTILEKGQVDDVEDQVEPEGESFSTVDISLTSFDDENGLQKALKRLIDISSDVNRHRDGNLWNLRFMCGEKRYTERQFFRQLAGQVTLYPLITDYLVNLIKYPSVLWENYYTPAGVSAIETLVKGNRDYLELFNRYLASELIDGDQEDDRITHLITAVIALYGWSEDTIDVILTRATHQNNKGLDQLQFFMASGELKQYLSGEKNRHYFRQHPLSAMLADDYFHIMMPGESQLYEAIVAEDIRTVKKVLMTFVDLEVRHPEYRCFALELALDVENIAILDLLLLHHKNIKDPELAKLYYCLANRKRSFSPFEQKQVDKAIFELSKKRGEILNQLSEMGFDELVTYQIGEKQMEKMRQLNQELETVNQELRFSRMGLGTDGQPLFFLSHTTESYEQLESSGRDAETIQKMKSGFYPNMIRVDDLYDEKCQLEALECLKKNLDHIDTCIQGKYLNFTFEDAKRSWSEEDFFDELDMTDDIVEVLVQYVQKLIKTSKRELWYDDEVQTGMYALQALVLYDEKYIETFIEYLNSDLVNTQDEQDYPNEIIYQALDDYDWCDETVRLILARSISCMGPCAKEEFRFWFKKGGLAEYLKEEENLNRFYDLLEEESGIAEKTDWIKTFLMEYSG